MQPRRRRLRRALRGKNELAAAGLGRRQQVLEQRGIGQRAGRCDREGRRGAQSSLTPDRDRLAAGGFHHEVEVKPGKLPGVGHELRAGGDVVGARNRSDADSDDG